MKHMISLIAVTVFLMIGLSLALSDAAASPGSAAQSIDKKLGNGTPQPAATTAANASVPLLLLSKACLDFNFRNHDAVTGMSMGSHEFNAGESITITGEQSFTVQITP